MKRTRRRRRCASALTLMGLHTAPRVLALIPYEPAVKTRANKDGGCLKEEVHRARLSAKKLWEGILV